MSINCVIHEQFAVIYIVKLEILHAIHSLCIYNRRLGEFCMLMGHSFLLVVH